MDTPEPEFLSVGPQTQDDQIIYNSVADYVNDGQFTDYATPVESTMSAENNEELLEPNLRVSKNLFQSRPEDVLHIKIENVECVTDHGNNATDDESMAVEALRQLGNSTYSVNKKSPRIETTTPHDLPLLPCSTCDLEFRTTADLNSHSEICRHSQFICPICSEVFDRKIDLNNHLVCHAVDRPHACRICSTLFIHKHDLQQHMLTHGSNMMNQCQVCAQQFNRPSSLTNHMKIHNYQPGRALINAKIEGTSELTDILTGNADPEIQSIQKITLPSINNITPMNNWNLNYEPENFNSDIQLDVDEDITTNDLEDNSRIENNIDNNIKLETAEIHPEITREVDETVKASNKKKPYECTKCPKTFAREKALISHLNLHKDVLDNYYTCERCDQNFNNGTALDRHMQHCGIKSKPRENKKTTVTTKSAPIQTAKNNNIQAKPERVRHPPTPEDFLNDSTFDVNVYNKIYKHSCTECGKNFTTKQKLFRHMWIHRKKVYSCELCNKTFDQQQQLDSHRLATHQSGSPYVCLECGKNFSSRQGLWEHNRIHTTEVNSFRCVECAKSFSSRQGYLIHKRKHSDERPYGCRFCWKAFRDGGTLRKHERIHTGERPHACPLCSKAFNQKVVLREHIRWLHTANLSPTEEGFFQCSICAASINDKDELCAHFVKHSDLMAQLAKDASKNNISSDATTSKVAKSIVPKVEEMVINIGLTNETDMEIAAMELEEVENLSEDSRGLIEHKLLLQEEVIIDQAVQEDIECDLCGDVFDNKNELTEHVRVHI